MRDPKRINEFCDKLKAYWSIVPDWRFSQLIMNVFSTAKRDPWFFEENDTLQMFDDYFKEDNAV